MLSVLTGVAVGVATGSVIGNGIEVRRDCNGRKRIKSFDLKQGAKKSSILPFAVLAVACLGSAVVVESINENNERKEEIRKNYFENMNSEQEIKEEKRKELLDKVDSISEIVYEDNVKQNLKIFSEMAKVARDNRDDLWNLTIGTVDVENGHKESLNLLESFGLASLTDEELELFIYSDARKKDEFRKEMLKTIIQLSPSNELDFIESSYLNEDNIDRLIEKELFIEKRTGI